MIVHGAICRESEHALHEREYRGFFYCSKKATSQLHSNSRENIYASEQRDSKESTRDSNMTSYIYVQVVFRLGVPHLSQSPYKQTNHTAKAAKS